MNEETPVPAVQSQLIRDMAAVLSSIGSAVVLAPMDGGLAWLSASAAELLSIPAGSIRSSCLDSTLRSLQAWQRDDSGWETLAADPHAVITDWEWRLEGPDVTALRVTTFPMMLDDTDVRAWVLDDVSSERKAQRRAESTGARLAETERSLAEARDATLASEAKVRAALEGVLDPHLLLQATPRVDGSDIDLEILVANQAALTYWGRSRAEVIGAQLVDLVPAMADASMTGEIRSALMDGHDAAVFDHPFPGPDGTPHRYDIRVSAMGRSQYALTWADVTERHEAAHQVDEARRYFQLLAENASEVVIRSSLPGLLEWISPSVEKVLGWHPAELQGTPLPDLIHPDDRDCVVATARESMGSFGRVCHTEARVRDANGSHRWMSITMKIAVDADDRPVARICTWRDIEAEVAVRGQLRDEMANREAISNSTIDAVISVSAGGQIVQWNEAATTLFGYPHDEALGQPFQLVVPERLVGIALGWLRSPRSEEVREGTSHIHRVWLNRRDGSEFPADVTFAVWERRGVQHFSGLVRDVTQQQRDLEDLEAARAELDEAQQLSRAGSWTYDLATGRCTWTIELGRIHALGPADDASGLEDLTAHLRDGGREVLDAVATVVSSGETAELGYEVQLPNGDQRRVQARIAAVRDARGRVRRLRGTAIDVTEIHRTEEVRARRVSAHADYLARVEHTLRTHLSVVEGWSGMLESASNQMDEATRIGALGAIRRNATALVGHVKSLMSESAHYAMADTIVPEPVDVAAVAAAAARDYSGLSDRRIVVGGDAPVPALGDTVALDTVVRHLIENAVNHTPDGGTVEVISRPTASGAELVVRDEGPGLPGDRDVFAPFAKGSASAGHGLGLHVVRTLVEAMGGEVTGGNAEGRAGAEFVVRLRLQEP